GGYVKELEASLGDIGFRGALSIMRSNGGVMMPEIATARPAAMMESGPVGGIIASAQVGCALGFRNVISFDMGGTTAKASLVREGEPTMAPGYHVGGYASGHPVMLPMIDVVEVGAGGGSIAWRDDVGALKVGPQSAGADPGPICYRGGGTEPTITDANVVLGRLDPDNFLGGTMKLDAAAALRGIKEKIASPLQLGPIAAAQAHDEMVKEARVGLRYGKDAQYQVHLDLRYVGQEFTLSVPVDLAQLKRGERKAIRTAFDQLYEHRYAHHSPEEPVEMVNIRLRAIGKRPKLTFPSVAATGAATP